MQLQEALEFARDLFAETHWGQGDYVLRPDEEDGKTRYCALGGVRLAYITKDLSWLDVEDPWLDYADEVPEYAATVRALKDAILATGYTPIHKTGVPVTIKDDFASSEAVVVVWNDDPVRTKEDVIALLDHVRATR